MINNFELIKNILKFDSEDDFYFLQIIKRKKEHPELGSNSYIVKTYYVKKLEEMDYYKDEIICLCELHNARAYINLNRRSFEKLAYQNLKKITDQILNKDFRSVRKSFSSVCGQFANEPDKTWIIDIDHKNMDEVDKLQMFIRTLNPDAIKGIVETKNGYHIIARPFNLQEFKLIYPDIDVHKNNPTILFTI